MLGSLDMNGFHRKLRRFKRNWLAQAEPARWAPPSTARFLFNADDTPRFGCAESLPETSTAMLPAAHLPGFRYSATYEAALEDSERRAA
jgi:hypothetical protein